MCPWWAALPGGGYISWTNMSLIPGSPCDPHTHFIYIFIRSQMHRVTCSWTRSLQNWEWKWTFLFPKLLSILTIVTNIWIVQMEWSKRGERWRKKEKWGGSKTGSWMLLYKPRGKLGEKIKQWEKPLALWTVVADFQPATENKGPGAHENVEYINRKGCLHVGLWNQLETLNTRSCLMEPRLGWREGWASS